MSLAARSLRPLAGLIPTLRITFAAARPHSHLYLSPLAPRSFAGLHTTAPRLISPTPRDRTGSIIDHAPTEDKDKKAVGDFGGALSEGPHFIDHTRDMTIPEDVDAGQWGSWKYTPIYTEKELDTVKVVHRTPVTVQDKLAHGTVRTLRRLFDVFTGYKDKPLAPEVTETKPIPKELLEKLRKDGDVLSPSQWLFRIIVLESIAGVPGMVGGTLRHLRSLRLLRRDGGWIHTLLDEAENERMHLLTFLAVSNPGYFTRGLVMLAQAGFYNVFFWTYLFSPKTAHRFVGALEEEAVRTYTHCVHDVEIGLLPEWEDRPAPKIAIDYWRLPTDAKLLDVIKAVRADEATHRFVNHSLADLDQAHDFNPFAISEPAPEVRGTMWGFTRDESAEFAHNQHQKMIQGQNAAAAADEAGDKVAAEASKADKQAPLPKTDLD